MDKMRILPGHPIAKAAIDHALYDIMGKAHRVPVYKLLGGAYREKISQAAFLGAKNVDDMRREALEWAEKGYDNFLVKLSGDPQKDPERVKAIREVLGDDVTLRLDANEGYSPDTAIKALRRMEALDLNVMSCDQPVPRWDLDGMARVAKAIDIPICADECINSPSDAINVIRKEAADILTVKSSKVGFYNAKKICAIAEATDIPCELGGMLTCGIGAAVDRHFATSTKVVQHDEGVFSPLSLYKDDIVKNTFPIGPYTKAPNGPGLGIEINEGKLKLYSVSL